MLWPLWPPSRRLVPAKRAQMPSRQRASERQVGPAYSILQQLLLRNLTHAVLVSGLQMLWVTSVVQCCLMLDIVVTDS